MPGTSAPSLTSPTTASRPSTSEGSPQLQRAGGLASLVEGTTYVIGFVVMAAYLAPRGFLDAQGSPSDSLTFLLDNQAAMYLWYLLIYLVAGVALVVLSLGIHDRLKHVAPAVAQVTTAFGLIWSGLILASGMVALVGQRAAVELAATDRAEAVSTWSAVSTVQDSLGGGIEIVGAIWVFLLSIASLRTGALPRGLSILGITTGALGAFTLIPLSQEGAASAFGLSFIAWYFWAAKALMRDRSSGRLGGVN